MDHWLALQHLTMRKARLAMSGLLDRLATTFLTAASAVVRALPFRALTRSVKGQKAKVEPIELDWNAARRMARAVESALRYLPWRTVCIQEALALQWLLRRHGIPSLLHYGIDPEGAELSAHVWVSLGEEILIGEEATRSHAQVATLPSNERFAAGG